ncbi:MAG: PQQ-dependent sugar dehydrogenase, partial [Verrucomicrobiota bacterium]
MSVRSFQVLWAFFISAFFLSTPIGAASSGHLALPSYEPASGFVFQDAFPGIHFDDPVAIAIPPGETNRLFVVERLGRIMVITNLAAPTKTLFMDLRNSITTTFFEDGLLGLAFHPNFASNGYFYVYRTYATSSAAAKYAFHDILARYSVSPDDPNKGLVSSEVRLIAQIDSQVYHNAGTIAFGPDGYLYLSIGDDGPAGEDTVPVFAQNIDKGLFGGIIRIDVDKKPSNLRPNSHPSSSTNYYIPRDNPFIGATNFNGMPVDPRKVRTEFYALGLRNPWSFTIHPTTGAIIAGDVGGATTEEVNEIVPGGNYGWPYFEGTAQSWPTPPGFTYRPPTIQDHHGRATNQGNCVIGGIFYFGNKLPGLYGKYIFGDFRTGNIWAAPYDPQTGLKSTLQRLTASTEIVAFAPDPRDNELLAVNTLNGRILRLNYIPPEEAPYFPQTLAQTGAFADLKTLTPISDFIPYNVNVTFWSDNAIKKRWFSTPPQSSITFSEDGNWLFPNGMVWMKHFDMELEKGNPSSRKRLETRFIVKNDTGVYGVTYKWDPSGTNAVLVPEEGLNEVLTISEGGTNRSQTWRYPSRSECLLCHTELGGLAIGFTTAQLNCTIDYGNGSGLENQLQAFANSGYFKNLHSITNIQDIRKLSKADDETAPVYDRVRSFMAANCQFCHQPGSLNARWDARPDTTLDKTGLILPYYLVIPHSPASSEVVRRLTLRGTDQMPPLASNVQDATDLKLITDWINGFPPAPWKSKDLSPIAREGSAHFDGQRIQVAGAGSNLSQVKDALHYAYFPSSNNITATVKLTQQNSDLPAASAGILLRANDSSD